MRASKGGGEIESVTMVTDTQAKITYLDRAAVERVLERPHVLNGVEVKVQKWTPPAIMRKKLTANKPFGHFAKGVSQSQPTVSEDVPLSLNVPCMSGSLIRIVKGWSERMKGISRENPPEVTVQKSTISADMEKELRKGDTWFLVDGKWWKQWKKYVGYDSWDMDGMGDPAYHPGTIDNSALFKDPKNPDAVFLKEQLIDQLDYCPVPVEAFRRLVSWYGIKDRHVIPRKVVEHDMFAKHCRVEVFPVELKLCRYPNMDRRVTQLFSKSNTIGQIEEYMRTRFNIPKTQSVRLTGLWCKYMSDTYEHLNKPQNTVKDSGLYQGQVSCYFGASGMCVLLYCLCGYYHYCFYQLYYDIYYSYCTDQFVSRDQCNCVTVISLNDMGINQSS
ncbi:ubiquitin carboxyl-terminal hydrolase 15-like [Branchiostoma floridae x Branchiostoma belcheri]